MRVVHTIPAFEPELAVAAEDTGYDSDLALAHQYAQSHGISVVSDGSGFWVFDSHSRLAVDPCEGNNYACDGADVLDIVCDYVTAFAAAAQ